MDRAYMEISKNFTRILYEELLLEWGYTQGVEALDEPDEVDAGGGVDVLDGRGDLFFAQCVQAVAAPYLLTKHRCYANHN
jgi:hypothetical protein